MSALEFEVRDHVATITMNRPEKLNAINQEMTREFRAAITAIEEDDVVKVAIVRGAGDRAFSSGADMTETNARTLFPRRRATVNSLPNLLRNCEKPVIASLRGYTVGGGLEVATACDIRMSSETAVFGYPEISHGWLPAGGGGTQSLPRLVGMGQAMRLILSGRKIGAAEALRIGLVDEVFADSELDAAVQALAGEIAQHRLGALVLAKAALRMAENSPLSVGLSYERELSALCFTFEGREEALRAFRERRAPEFPD